ncbi:GTP-binding protein [Aliiroseovarius sp. PrR006]|uniref:CobW family GTP-binding protein n=1 Tax=Aliiroseovarius sp. PrR006 TaxID=2706883 RepID=UPI0013CFF277|nr:CobW family GTP-binding protein [Aliiroseovarius sp. PrR006]NDW54284.1 GTP-binding protein [Aliiroseovarius sp. PrR006]
MSESSLPVTVIGGYLGAGKTTLINRLLAAEHGKRVMVLVNDFGAINIDAQLLESADEDTIALTNGCVCCTMGNDLYMAISDAMKRTPRPDHLIIEASGIANPQKIANTAISDPDLTYNGIVTVVDAENIDDLLADPMICAQVGDQIACADLLVVSKSSDLPIDLRDTLERLSDSEVILADDMQSLLGLTFSDLSSPPKNVLGTHHPTYTQWQYQGDVCLDRNDLKELMLKRPRGIYRAKGFVRSPDGSGWRVQVVGSTISIMPEVSCEQTIMVCIGSTMRFDKSACEAWWAT